MRNMDHERVEQIKKAFQADDVGRVRGLLDSHPELKAKINEPLGPFDSPPIVNVRSRSMLDVLLEAGADLNAKSRWWAGGFGLLDWASPEVAAYAIERGAFVDVHAAARLGMMSRLRELISLDPGPGPRARRRRADTTPLRQLGRGRYVFARSRR